MWETRFYAKFLPTKLRICFVFQGAIPKIMLKYSLIRAKIAHYFTAFFPGRTAGD